MPDWIYLFAVLACPIAMGTMMLLMMRGGHGHQASTGSAEVAQLRAEVEDLRANLPPSDVPPTEAGRHGGATERQSDTTAR